MPTFYPGQTDYIEQLNILALAAGGVTTASGIANVPAGGVAGTNVQVAINELDTEKAPKDSPTFTGTVSGITKTMVGLSNVDNTSDVNKPVSTAQATSISAAQTAAQTYADGLVVGLWDDRGNYSASGNVFPSSGGSGSAGAILKGDIWTVSVAGTLGGVPVSIGQTVRALVNTPGSTSSNWAIATANTSIDDSITDGVSARAPSQNAVYDALLLKTTASTLSATSGASLIGTINSGTGAASVTVESKLQKIIVDGDYSTAQQAAVAAINKVFFVPVATTVSLTVPTDVATIDAAFLAISRWVIPIDSIVQIIIPSGNTALSAATTTSHPYGARINILGAAVVSTTASAVGSITGSAGAWSIPITVASSSGIAVGDYMLIRTVVGTGSFYSFSGICKITATAGALITVLNTSKNTSWPTSTFTSANITVIKTFITYTGCDGLRIDGDIGQIDRVVLVGNKTAGTIGLLGQRSGVGNKTNAHIYIGSSFGITGFGDGGVYAQNGGTVDAQFLCVADCLIYNVLAQHNGVVFMNDGISTGCTEAGISASSGGAVSAERAISCGNGTYGEFAFQSGTILSPNCFLYSNISDGLRAAYGGTVRGQSMSIKYNGGSGTFNVCASIVATSATITNNALSGVVHEGGGGTYAGATTCSSNGAHGMYSDGGNIDAPSAILSSNGINGATAVNGGILLLDQVSGSGNVTYFISASGGATVRATNASASGQTLFCQTGAILDVTGATGSPTLTKGTEGIIINTSGTLTVGARVSDSVSVNGAVATSVFNSAKNSTFSSEGSASGVFQNITDPLKMLVFGYDNTNDFGYLQSLRSTSGYKNIALQPNGANVGIGLGSTAPTGRLHLPAGTATAGTGPLMFTNGTLVTSAVDGLIEYSTHFYITKSGTRRTIADSTDLALKADLTGAGFTGAIGIGAAAGVTKSLDITKNMTGGTTVYGIKNSGVVQSDATAEAIGIQTNIGTQATSFTLPDLEHFFASQGTIGAGSTITRQSGFYIASNLTGATSNYGVNSNIASGSNRWNLYIQGTAANYFAGDMQLARTITAGGTTGAQTINKTSGSVNFAAAVTSLVVTNSLVTASSIVIPSVGSNDTTMKSVNVVTSAGSFTLTANAAATAETRVNFVVFN